MDEKLKKTVIELIENSIEFQINQINYTVDVKSIEIWDVQNKELRCSNLISLIGMINKLVSYFDYKNDINKIILHIF